MAELLTISTDLIDVSPHNPRRVFNNNSLYTLANSISRIGVLQPILVIKASKTGRYEIIAGERRWKASRIAQQKEIPALIVDFDDPLLREVQLIENLERDPLNPIDEALAFKSLQERFGYTDVTLAQRLKRSTHFIRGRLDLLKLHSTVQQYLAEEKISLGAALELSRLEESDIQLQFAKQIERDKLTTNDVAQLVNNYKAEQRLKSQRKSRKLRFKQKVQALAIQGTVITSENYHPEHHHRIWDLVFTECTLCTEKGTFLRDDQQIEDVCIKSDCYNTLLLRQQEQFVTRQRSKYLERLRSLERVLHTEEVSKEHLQYQLWVMLNLMGPAANAWRKEVDLPPYSDAPSMSSRVWDHISLWSYEQLLTDIVHLSVSYIATLSNSYLPKGLKQSLISKFGVHSHLLDESPI